MVQQIALDLYTFDTIDWENIVLIFDSSVNQQELDPIVRNLREKNGFLTIFDLGDANSVSRMSLQNSFKDVKPYEVGHKFIALVSKNVAPLLMETVR